MSGWRRKPPPTISAVYALLDTDHAPLYVGATVDLKRRMIEHSYRATWWSQATYLTWHLAPDNRAERANRERVAIQALAPPHNICCVMDGFRVVGLGATVHGQWVRDVAKRQTAERGHPVLIVSHGHELPQWQAA